MQDVQEVVIGWPHVLHTGFGTGIGKSLQLSHSHWRALLCMGTKIMRQAIQRGGYIQSSKGKLSNIGMLFNIGIYMEYTILK